MRESERYIRVSTLVLLGHVTHDASIADVLRVIDAPATFLCLVLRAVDLFGPIDSKAIAGVWRSSEHFIALITFKQD